MRISIGRVRAMVRKELGEYRRNRSLLSSMAILPLVFIVQPLIAVVRLDAGASGGLRNEHVLLYMLGIPILVPVLLAATAIVGERAQGTLEPVLTTPITDIELLLAKALATLVPAVLIAYAVYALFLVLVTVLADPSVASALIRGPDLLAQLVFTPLLAVGSIWVGIGVSTRTSDVRVSQQLGLLACLPAVILVVLIAVDVIPPTAALALGALIALVVFDGAGAWIVSRLIDRERLIAGAR
jgi:ABC-type transport system involved in multi-copper enzyme maturation permease subunit